MTIVLIFSFLCLKFHLHSKFQQTNPNLVEFLNLVKTKRNTEYKIAESKGKLKQHFKKWILDLALEASYFFVFFVFFLFLFLCLFICPTYSSYHREFHRGFLLIKKKMTFLRYTVTFKTIIRRYFSKYWFLISTNSTLWLWWRAQSDPTAG